MTFSNCLYLLLCFSLIFLEACSTTVQQKSKYLSDQEKDIYLQENLTPLIKTIFSSIGPKKIFISNFYSEGTKIEPRMATYIIPRIENALSAMGAKVLERKNLKPILLEQIMDENRIQQGGKIEGADIIIFGTVREISTKSYSLEIRILDVDNASLIMQTACILNKEYLPIRYGGI